MPIIELDTKTTPHATTVSLINLGCAKNEVDSEEMLGQLRADGYHD